MGWGWGWGWRWGEDVDLDAAGLVRVKGVVAYAEDGGVG